MRWLQIAGAAVAVSLLSLAPLAFGDDGRGYPRGGSNLRAAFLSPGATGSDLSLSGNLTLSAAAPGITCSAATSTCYLKTAISAANAGATAATSAISLFPTVALDSTDYVLNVGNAANAASLLNLTYGGGLVTAGSITSGLTGFRLTDTGNTNAGLFSGTAAGTTALSATLRGDVANSAGNSAMSFLNVTTLTAGTDRYIATFYNDNVSTVQSRITTDGTYLGGYGPVTKTASKTAPTVVACSGTAASVTWSNGTSAFVFDVGTSCTSESTAVFTMPAATNGWICSCSSTTADRILQQKVIPPASTTAVTMQNIVISTGANGDFTDGADVGCICHGG